MEGLINKMKNIHRDPSLSLTRFSAWNSEKNLVKEPYSGRLVARSRKNALRSSFPSRRRCFPFPPLEQTLHSSFSCASGGSNRRPAVPVARRGSLHAQNSFTVEYMENGEDDVKTFSASDPEGARPIVWSLPADGDDPDGTDGPLAGTDPQDNGDFKISQDGVLRFRSPPDYENPEDVSHSLRQHLQCRRAGLRRRDHEHAQLVQGDRQRIGYGGGWVDKAAPDRSGRCHAVAATGWGEHNLPHADG